MVDHAGHIFRRAKIGGLQVPGKHVKVDARNRVSPRHVTRAQTQALTTSARRLMYGLPSMLLNLIDVVD